MISAPAGIYARLGFHADYLFFASLVGILVVIVLISLNFL